MSESDAIRLRHMWDAANEALSIRGDRSHDDLLSDRTATLAVIKDIEIIGEAASKVSAKAGAAAPTIPWADIVGMRNRLVHAYFDIASDMVWDTVDNDLPFLIRELRLLLQV